LTLEAKLENIGCRKPGTNRGTGRRTHQQSAAGGTAPAALELSWKHGKSCISVAVLAHLRQYFVPEISLPGSFPPVPINTSVVFQRWGYAELED